MSEKVLVIDDDDLGLGKLFEAVTPHTQPGLKSIEYAKSEPCGSCRPAAQVLGGSFHQVIRLYGSDRSRHSH